MNWLGWSSCAVAGALAGAVVGCFLFGLALAHGWELAFVVGLLAGAGAACFATERSVLRGILVATIAVWAAALRETGASSAIFTFHETLTPTRVASYVACALLALALGARACRTPRATLAEGSEPGGG
jgi:hypothetical protein